MATIIKAVRSIPVPQFGNLTSMAEYGRNLGRCFMQPEMVPWAFTGIVGGAWFIWPALDDEWKQSWGFGTKDTELVVVAVPEAKGQVHLSEEAVLKIESAHKAAVHEVTEIEKAIKAEVNAGNFATLEGSWEADMADFMKTEDEDEDDEDEDEEEEDEEDDDEDE